MKYISAFIAKYTRLQRLCMYFIVIFAGYVIGGFVLLPFALTTIVPSYISKNILEGDISIQKVYCNPFSLQGEINGLRITDVQKKTVIAIKHALIDFQLLESLYSRRIVLNKLTSSNVEINVTLYDNFTLNLQSLLQKKYLSETKLPKEKKPFLLPPLDIKKITLDKSRVLFQDKHFNFRRTIKDITFIVTGFSTRATAKNPMIFFCKTITGAEISWEGNVSFNPLSSQGEWRIKGFKPETYGPYYSKIISAKITSGTVDGFIKYTLNPASKKPFVKIIDGEMQITDLCIVEPKVQKELLRLNKVSLTGMSIDGASKKLFFTKAEIFGETLFVSRDSHNNINLLQHLLPTLSSSRKKKALQALKKINEKYKLKPNAQKDFLYTIKLSIERIKSLIHFAWDAQLKTFKLHYSEVEFADTSPPQAAHIILGPIDVNLNNITNKKGAQTDIGITMKYAPHGTVELKGTASPFPFFAQAQISLKNIDLTSLSPYAQQYIAHPITKGWLTSTEKVRIKGTHIQTDINILLHQLELGAKQKNPNAINLPFKLGLALLKDRDGKIELPPIEVKGDLTDPTFDMTKVIGYALSKIVTNVASAPFNFIAGIIHQTKTFTQEELEYILMPSGTAVITTSEGEKLGFIAEALYRRPQVHLGIYPQVRPAFESKEAIALYLEKKIDDCMRNPPTALSSIISQPHNWNMDLHQKKVDRYDALHWLYVMRFPEKAEIVTQLLHAYPTDPKNISAQNVEVENPYTLIYNELLETTVLPSLFWENLEQQRAEAIIHFIQQKRNIPRDRFVVYRQTDTNKKQIGVFLTLE